MKRVCAWCGKPLGTKPGPDDEVTHSICDDCLKKERAKLRAPNALQTLQAKGITRPTPVDRLKAEGFKAPITRVDGFGADNRPAGENARNGRAAEVLGALVVAFIILVAIFG